MRYLTSILLQYIILLTSQYSNSRDCYHFLLFLWTKSLLTIMIGDVGSQRVLSSINYLFNFLFISQQLKINQTCLISENEERQINISRPKLSINKCNNYKERQEIALFERIFNLDIRSFVIIACHLYSQRLLEKGNQSMTNK